jgi:hypothetical protein
MTERKSAAQSRLTVCFAARQFEGDQNMASPTQTNLSSAPAILDREFLELRANLLKVAAQLDRIDRAAGTAASDPRVRGISKALAVLAGTARNRAEQVQIIFSRQYDSDWKTKMEISPRA